MSASAGIEFPAPWLHVVIDMQRLFAEPGPWYAPTMHDIVEPIARLARHSGADTVFTRFITPHQAQQATGTWQGYYEHWASVRLDHIPEEKLDVMTALAAYASPASLCNKTTHSAFNSGPFRDRVRERAYATLVLSGVETDVCVLATALDAVDLGLGVVIAADAVTSSSDTGHAATLAHVYPRYAQQICMLDVHSIIAAWPSR